MPIFHVPFVFGIVLEPRRLSAQDTLFGQNVKRWALTIFEELDATANRKVGVKSETSGESQFQLLAN